MFVANKVTASATTGPTPLMTLDHKRFPFLDSFSRFIRFIKKGIFNLVGCTILINEYYLFRVLPRECFVYVVHAASLAIFALFFMNIQVKIAHSRAVEKY